MLDETWRRRGDLVEGPWRAPRDQDPDHDASGWFNGAGLGASHQTGWTGLIAKTIQLYGLLDPQKALEVGKQAAFTQNSK